MKKILFVIAPQNFRDTELIEPIKVLEKAGIETEIASTEVGKSQGANGTIINVSLLISQINPDDYDGVAVVGGPGMVPLIDDIELKRLVANFYQSEKLTAAICAAVGILANADLVKGKKVTAWSGVEDLLTSKGAEWLSKPVVIDGNLITAEGPQAAIEFGHAIAKLLC